MLQSVLFGWGSEGRPLMRRVLSVTVLAAALCGSLAVANAQAATVTLGSPLTGTFTPAMFGSVATVVQTALPGTGAVLASPVTGTVVAWRVTEATGGPFYLRVVTPNTGGSFTGAGTSAPETPSSTATQTYTTDMPISAGQMIGLNNTNTTDTIGTIALTGAAFDYWEPPLADGATSAPTDAGVSDTEVGFNAIVQPLPTVASVSPSSGLASGGTAVVITGTNFDGATGVSFGSTPAKSFNVVSDTEITAVAPPGAGSVNVTVSNPGQSIASAADLFTYIPRPVVSAVTPSHGFRTGGTAVTISGSGFTGATAVSFGGKPAKRFNVKSASSISAVAPAHAVGTVGVAVTTLGGTSSATTAFTFRQACVVPKLKGKKLKAARKSLKKAHCKLGKVKGTNGTTAKVKKQKPKPGKIFKAGTKVNVTIKL